MSLILAIVSEAILWPPCLWADKTIRQANSESEEIIGSFSCPKTAIRVELDNLPVVTWIDLLTPSKVLEEPSKLFSLPWENNRSIFGIASLNNNSQTLREASELAIVKHGYLFVKQALDKYSRDFSDLSQCIIIVITRHRGINYNRIPQRGILCCQKKDPNRIFHSLSGNSSLANVLEEGHCILGRDSQWNLNCHKEFNLNVDNKVSDLIDSYVSNIFLCWDI